jgi:hypothetical protein
MRTALRCEYPSNDGFRTHRLTYRSATTPSPPAHSTATTPRPSVPAQKVHRQSWSTSTTSALLCISILNKKITNALHRSLTLKEAETLTLRTLKQVMEEKLDAKNVQLSSITKEKGFRIYTDEEMKECVGKLEGN